MKNGFTLIESVVVTGVTALALLALVNLFFVFATVYGYEQAFIATAGSSAASMNALEGSILPANRVLASYDFSGVTYTSTTSAVVLELPTVTSAGAIVPGAKDYIAFYRSGNNFYRLTQADPQSVRLSGQTRLSTTLQGLSFTYDNADFTQVRSVNVTLHTRATWKNKVAQSYLQEQIYLRNYYFAP